MPGPTRRMIIAGRRKSRSNLMRLAHVEIAGIEAEWLHRLRQEGVEGELPAAPPEGNSVGWKTIASGCGE